MTAQLLKLPTPCDRTERQLRASWAKEDALAGQLRLARLASRNLEKAMARQLGYGGFTRREALERALGGR
jgi:predicted alpha/beta hydrolase